MKRVNLIFLICVLVTVICGCEQEVKMPVAKSSYPVVYSVLNKDDTAHYVRLTKTFSGPVDATIMAQNPDSLYYKNARVFAEMGMTKIEMLPTNEIDRDAGVFITGFNRMYKTTFRLCGNVVIHIFLPDYDTEVIGSTKLVPDLVFTAPDTLLKKELSFFETEPVKIIWNGLKNICQTNIRFKYLEVSNSGADTCYVDWIRKDCVVVIVPEDLLYHLNAWIGDDPGVRYRKVIGFDILVSTGNDQLLDFMTYKDWVIDYIEKPYSNVINAYGLVASRANGALLDYQPNHKFIDSLANSRLTKHLKFVVW